MKKLVANRDQAIELVGVETYNRYLMFFASAYRYFDDGVGTSVRWVMEKRDHQLLELAGKMPEFVTEQVIG